jgi:hypothetical protein
MRIEFLLKDYKVFGIYSKLNGEMETKMYVSIQIKMFHYVEESWEFLPADIESCWIYILKPHRVWKSSGKVLKVQKNALYFCLSINSQDAPLVKGYKPVSHVRTTICDLRKFRWTQEIPLFSLKLYSITVFMHVNPGRKCSNKIYKFFCGITNNSNDLFPWYFKVWLIITVSCVIKWILLILCGMSASLASRKDKQIISQTVTNPNSYLFIIFGIKCKLEETLVVWLVFLTAHQWNV